MDGDLGRWRRCVLGGAVFAVCMAGTTLPTPLYGLYQEKFGFNELTVTVVYAVYAFGVIGVLLLAGNASDSVGRRPVLLWGLGFSAASAVCFLCATALGWLYAGRLLSGLSAGLFTGAATAYVMELAPLGGASRATFVATAANMGGLGCGPLLAGVLAQYADWPLYLPFAVHLALVACSAAALWRLPETVRERRPLSTVRPQRPSLPPQVRVVFGPAAAASFVGFALFGVFTSVSPAFLAQSLNVHNHAVSGLVVALAFFASTAGQLAVGRVGTSRSLPLGCAGLLAGLALLAGALRWELLALVVLSAVVGGAGQGLAFRGALSAVAAASEADRRAAVISALFVVAYTGISVPVIGVGLLAEPLGLEGAGLVFIACMALLVSIAGVYLLRRPVPATEADRVP
ncbi:MFS transporter [Streptomyces europaeiscabiei]|uniref:MFS transporter n=1 Tax=Streptomyces europaeiscabiei TaxID=146819 RepID=A0ABU4NDZ2_9ACTN|nr:MFS transporter [Streptomyces europaeiscabiei]MDX2526319.1 MFS transporter [Streptomyces europaeiscabiei]MDX2759072.1 MFS transporter [Streptomyces europaeiscabiei]MDX2767780.1 MFS transporter [Streptomyces europaeiscabiei]MDX3549345.1 MFS transporter [Streptomyces europaeiscabiei]MDX3552139.1 MFS transporter [Streptomyces europaeiscabiei]